MDRYSDQFSKRNGNNNALLVLLAVALASAVLTTPSYACPSRFGSRRAAFAQTRCDKVYKKLLPTHHTLCLGEASPLMTCYMTNNDRDDEDELNNPPSEFDLRRADKQVPGFMDAMLEIPDPRLLAGDLLFILMINFLLQIANEIGDPAFWLNGGFSQPVTMPTTLLAVVVRDSKMSLAWILGALWNRSYSSSSVSDDETAVKTALQVWVDYCSLRILLELGESFLFTHSAINIWMLGREVWYTAIIMAFFRFAYGRFR